MADRQSLEAFFGMSSGYVLNFSDSTFGEFVFEKTGIDIHSSCYTNEGTSKAKKLRAFLEIRIRLHSGKAIARPNRLQCCSRSQNNING
jgi:hypothetical protein